MHRFQHAAMAAQFEIRCACPDGRYAGQAARAAFDVVDRLELQLSRFVENSDITRINQLPPGQAAIVCDETMQCLQLASLMHRETRGAFDIALGTGFDSLELAAEQCAVVVRPGTAATQEHPLSPDVTLRAASGLRRDTPPSSSLRLDLGAIGKGYAVDRIADVLADWELDQVLIDAASSSVLALEPPDGADHWPLTISDPGDAGRIFARIPARQRALGASGIRRGDHIVDPASGEPVRARSAAWVSAPRLALAAIGRQAGVEHSAAAVADALSTAFMICSHDDISAFCATHPGIEAWILEGELMHFPAAVAPDNG